jgi:D-arginine dehydrogenase
VVDVVETFYFKSGAGVLLRLPAHAAPGRHMTRGRGNSIFAGHSPHCRATTLQIRRPMRPWIGLCSFDADGNMVLGWDRDCDGVSGSPSRGYGIQSVLGAAALARRLLLG